MRMTARVASRLAMSAVVSLLVLAGLGGVPGGAGETAETPRLFSRAHPAMGTTFSLYLYAADEAAADRAAEHVFAVVDDLEALLSNYQSLSELSRINSEAGIHTVTTDPETFRFLAQSMKWSARSDGAFDITVGRLMKAWGFFRSTGHVPSNEELAAVRAKTGWRRVMLDAKARTVRFTSPGVELDPGGIGKGFAVDAAVDTLRADGIRAALLSAGSSTIYALGAPPGAAGWQVRVPDPLDRDRALSNVTLRDTSISTANCSEKHFVVAGHQYCHIMDPRTLRPVEGRLQATVIAPSATDSDALSNAVFVLNAKGRQQLMRSLPREDRALVVLPGRNGGERCEVFRWVPAATCGK
jgi:thiamine biosynthesis lipoprotein